MACIIHVHSQHSGTDPLIDKISQGLIFHYYVLVHSGTYSTLCRRNRILNRYISQSTMAR